MRQELTQVVQQNCLKDSTRGSLRGMTQGVLSYQKEAKNRAFCFKKSGKQIAEPVKITIEKIRDAFTPPPRFSRVSGELGRQNKRGVLC